MLDLKSCGAAAKDWMRRHRVVLSEIGLFIGLVLYVVWFAWQGSQSGDVTLARLLALGIPVVVLLGMMAAVSSYRKEVFVAVVGMVVGAAAGAIPYLVVGVFLFLLGLSPEDQATSEEFRQLFNNRVFSELFFVAGAASGGPVAVYVYFEKRKEKAAESGKAG